MASANVLGLDCAKEVSSKVLMMLGLGARQYELLRRSIRGCVGMLPDFFGQVEATLLLLPERGDVGELGGGCCVGHGVLGSNDVETLAEEGVLV